MRNISGFGIQAWLIASVTYPVGIPVTSFSDDTDAIDFPSIQIADKAMGVNGDLITWAKANPVNVTVSLIPDTPDDIALSLLLNANRPGYGKTIARDIITLSIIYPTGNIIVLENGSITDGVPINSVASVGRIKTRTYSFSFENYV